MHIHTHTYINRVYFWLYSHELYFYNKSNSETSRLTVNTQIFTSRFSIVVQHYFIHADEHAHTETENHHHFISKVITFCGTKRKLNGYHCLVDVNQQCDNSNCLANALVTHTANTLLRHRRYRHRICHHHIVYEHQKTFRVVVLMNEKKNNNNSSFNVLTIQN